MKCQSLFSGENKKKNLKQVYLISAEILPSMLRVKEPGAITNYIPDE